MKKKRKKHWEGSTLGAAPFQITAETIFGTCPLPFSPYSPFCYACEHQLSKKKTCRHSHTMLSQKPMFSIIYVCAINMRLILGWLEAGNEASVDRFLTHHTHAKHQTHPLCTPTNKSIKFDTKNIMNDFKK